MLLISFHSDKITLGDLRRCKMAHIFYNTFFNLDKYIEFEQRDPFATAKVRVMVKIKTLIPY